MPQEEQEPEGDASSEDRIEVLEGALLVAQIYQDCTWEVELPFGSAKLFFRDIAATEILAACELHQAPPDLWPGIVKLIKRNMVPAARDEFNKPR